MQPILEFLNMKWDLSKQNGITAILDITYTVKEHHAKIQLNFI